ncbi:protein RER1B-like [Apium graveolens]|uniref:protein RER1B-like n=1 Tax=Apium graveolens TaxID=4045 RepID=UPI003D7909B1
MKTHAFSSLAENAVDRQPAEGGSPRSPRSPLAKLRNDYSTFLQFYLDKCTPFPAHRWLGTFVLAFIYAVRIYHLGSFYAVTYGLGIYILNLLIDFISPIVDPELEELDGAELPTKESDDFRPFIRRLPEFKFWYGMTKAFCVAFLMTFISLFDVPVFWPILLGYWIVQFVLTLKRHITHMIKYKYVPLTLGKQTYTGKKSAAVSPRCQS